MQSRSRGSSVLVAGIVAAAMSTLDSSLNAVAAVVTSDWVRLLHGPATVSDARFMVLGRRVSVGMAALTIVAALGLTAVEKESTNDLCAEPRPQQPAVVGGEGG